MAVLKSPNQIQPNNGAYHPYGSYGGHQPWQPYSTYGWKPPQVPYPTDYNNPYQNNYSTSPIVADLPSLSTKRSFELLSDSRASSSVAFKSDLSENSFQDSRYSFEDSDIEEVPPLPPPLDISLLSDKSTLVAANKLDDTKEGPHQEVKDVPTKERKKDIPAKEQKKKDKKRAKFR